MKNRENVSKYPARSLKTSISNLETGRKGTNFEDETEPLWERKFLENVQNYPASSLDIAIFVWYAKGDPK